MYQTKVSLYITFQHLDLRFFLNVFEEVSFSTSLYLFDQKYSKN